MRGRLRILVRRRRGLGGDCAPSLRSWQNRQRLDCGRHHTGHVGRWVILLIQNS